MMAATCPRNGSRWPFWKLATASAPSATKRRLSKGAGNRPGSFYRDNLARIVVDVPDRKENRTWIQAFKKRWKEKLEQLEIWMISYRIDIE